MALLHEKSSLALKTELDLFNVPSTQSAIEDSSYIILHPLNSSLTNQIEFKISGSGEELIDPSSLLIRVKMRVTKLNGQAFDQNDKVAPSCYLLGSLWSQIDVYWNDQLISMSNNLYPYRAYLEALLTTSRNVQKSTLTAALWYKDFDSREKKGEMFEVMGRLHADICFQPKLLLSGTDLRICLVRSKNEFCLQTMKPELKEYGIDIQEVVLYVRKVKVSPSVTIAHAKTLEKNNALYPLMRTELKSYIIPKGIMQHSIENLIIGTLPSRIIFGLVDSEACLGSITKDCFNFQHFDLNFLTLHVDSKQFPVIPYTPDFSRGLCTREYLGLIDNLGKFYDKNHGINISYNEFKDSPLFAFDLTSDNSASDDMWSLIKVGMFASHYTLLKV